MGHLVLALGSAYSSVDPSPQIFADLPGHLPADSISTPPFDILLPTSQRPVLIFPYRKIDRVDLTVPFDSNLDVTPSRNYDCYASLSSDMGRAYSWLFLFSIQFSFLVTSEVGDWDNIINSIHALSNVDLKYKSS